MQKEIWEMERKTREDEPNNGSGADHQEFQQHILERS